MCWILFKYTHYCHNWTSSYMTAPTLLMNEHLKKKLSMFLCSFYQLQLSNSFSHTFSSTWEEINSYLDVNQQFMCQLIFKYTHYCHKSGKKVDFSQKLHFLCNQLDFVLVFSFFTCTHQNQSGTTEWPAVQ